MNTDRHIAELCDWPVQGDGASRLRETLVQGVVPHAILLAGHTQLTSSVSEYLAKLLLCVGGGTRPCGECSSCLQFEAGNHPDYHVIGDADLGVKTGDVERMQDALRLRAHSGGRLVYLMHSVDKATLVAANRVLKTLEEPEPDVIAILSCTNEAKVLPTILSRTFLYRLDANAWQDAMESSSFSAQNRQDPEFARLESQVIEWTQALVIDKGPAMLLADSFLKLAPNERHVEVLTLLSLWLRDVLHTAVASRDHLRFPDRKVERESLVQVASVPQLARAIEIVIDAKSRLQYHVSSLGNAEWMCVQLRRVFS